MKKILVMSALVAISTAFVACSNENDLVQQKPDVPEESTVGRTPMTIIVADEFTRGKDFSTTNPLKAFTMYSSMMTPDEAKDVAEENPPAKFVWRSGQAFTSSDGISWTTNGDLDWQTQDNTTYTFYAINDPGNLTKDNGNPVLPPSVTEESVQFKYTLPTTYEDQVDLLVAKSVGGAQYAPSYNDINYPEGSLFVNFQHALALIKNIKVYCSAAKMEEMEQEGWIPMYHFRVNSIKLCGLKTVGTYTFDAATPWAVDETSLSEEYEIPLDIPTDDEEAFERMTFVPGTKTSNALVLPLKSGNSGLYLIPQKVECEASMPTPDNWVLSGAYAEIELQAAWFDPEVPESVIYQCWNPAIDLDKDPEDPDYDPTILGTAWDAESSKKNGFLKVRTPLNFDISGGSGKGYTLIIDISGAIGAEEGQYIKTGMSIWGTGITINV